MSCCSMLFGTCNTHGPCSCSSDTSTMHGGSLRADDFFPDPYDAVLKTGRWRRLRVLGSGGLAVVYLAEDMKGSLGKVALKVLRSQAQPVHAFELHREAFWSLTRLHCRQHVRYDPLRAKLFVKYLEDHTGFDRQGALESFEEHRRRHEAEDFDWTEIRSFATRPYVVMEYLPGQVLWDILSQRLKTSPITSEERQAILIQVAKACLYLQEHQLIHRDLRPCNLQLCRRGRQCQVKLMDLGVMIAVGASRVQRREEPPSPRCGPPAAWPCGSSAPSEAPRRAMTGSRQR
ncbi:unnamed protein product, partial [Durusdinium trenchii]